jgi:Domain of unknown function (DUF4124)
MKYMLTINSLLVHFFIIPVSLANIYKWTDANGNTQLSDLPPLKIQAHNLIEINTPDLQKNTEKANYSTVQNMQFIKTKNCTIARDNLKKLNNSNIVLNKNKKLIKLSKNEHVKKILEAKSQIEHFC